MKSLLLSTAVLAVAMSFPVRARELSAPGYLVTCGKVFTQSGRGTAKEL